MTDSRLFAVREDTGKAHTFIILIVIVFPTCQMCFYAKVVSIFPDHHITNICHVKRPTLVSISQFG